MKEIDLFTRAGGYVVTLRMFEMTPPPEVIGWGSRIFVFENATQKYVEGLLFYPDAREQYFKADGE